MPDTHNATPRAPGGAARRKSRRQGEKKLSAAAVEKATVPAGLSVWSMADGGGLRLVVARTRSGEVTKTWRFRYRLRGVSKRGRAGLIPYDYTIGMYPHTSLAEAREELKRVRDLPKAGISPVQARRADEARNTLARVNTLEAVAKEWLAAKESEISARTARQRRNALAHHVYPALGKTPIASVTTPMLNDLLTKIAAGNGAKGKGGPQIAKLVLQCLGGIFRHAAKAGLVTADPTTPHQRGTIATAPTEHNQELEEAEIGPLLRALHTEESPLTRLALRLAFHTLARSNEVIGARWDEFDLDRALWIIPAARMKMGEAHNVPLPAQTVAMLRGLKAISEGDYLFPNRKNRERAASHGLLWKAVARLDNEKYAGKFSPHGIRGTGSTLLNSGAVLKSLYGSDTERRYNGDWIERQLAHKERNKTRGAYNHADYLDERARMMQEWADYLDKLEAGAEVIDFREARRSRG